MRKTVYLLVVAVVTGLIFYFLGGATASPGMEISVNSTEHTVAMPYEKSFRFVATIKNSGSNVEEVSVSVPEGGVPKEWHLLAPVGRYELAPGQEIDYVAVFEPGEGPGATSKEETVTVPITFSWDGNSKKFDITVKTKHLPWREKKDDLSNITVFVVDKTTNKPISNASVFMLLPTGVEQSSAKPTEKGHLLTVPSGEYLI